MQYLFVYGTLRAGEVNDLSHAAARHGVSEPVFVGAAMVRGRLFDFGRHPGLVLEATAGWVRGDVFEIDDALVPVLDDIEEGYPDEVGMFPASEVTVEVDGRELRCLFYPVVPEFVANRPRIESGDWVAHRRAQGDTPDAEAGH